jgi:hypothetical protein
MNRPAALFSLAMACTVVFGFGGTASDQRLPQIRLIVLGDSIGGIRLDEPRRSVEKAFGHGTSGRRGFVSYFGGRLVVDYWFHDGLTTRVESLETRWGGFHTRSGVHVGSSRQELRALQVSCSDSRCGLAAGKGPDAPGTGFTMRRGKVVQIDVSYS